MEIANNITTELSRVTEENHTRKMAYRWIVEWLLSIGALEERDGGKFATASGQALGIRSEMRFSETRGTHDSVVLYDPQAQQFIYDNLETILAKRFGQ